MRSGGRAFAPTQWRLERGQMLLMSRRRDLAVRGRRQRAMAAGARQRRSVIMILRTQ
jgi:hypothetical protein